MQKGQRHQVKRGAVATAIASMFKTNIGGQAVMVGREQLKDGWESCHGTALTGVKVESLDIQVVGDQAFVRKPGGRIEHYGDNDFEIAAVKYALKRGYKVIGPNGQEITL